MREKSALVDLIVVVLVSFTISLFVFNCLIYLDIVKPPLGVPISNHVREINIRSTGET